MILIRSKQTNSINDEEWFEWELCEDHNQADLYETGKKIDIHEWNTNTPGARSWRYIYFERYTLEQFLTLTMDDLKGLSIGKILTFINS